MNDRNSIPAAQSPTKGVLVNSKLHVEEIPRRKEYLKNSILTLLALISTSCFLLKAQPNIQYQLHLNNKKCLNKGVYYRNVFETKQGALYALDTDTLNDNDAKLIRLNANFDTVWTKSYGGSDEDYMERLQELPNGHLLLAGTTQSKNGDVWYGHTYSAKEIWIMEVDTNGTIIKGKTFGGSNGSDLEDVTVSSDGMIYLAGTTIADDYDFAHFSFGWLDSDAWLAKYDTNFNKIWIRVFSGNTDEGLTSIQEISASRLVFGFVTGGTDTNMVVSEAKGDADILAGMIDSSGNIIWKHRYGSISTDEPGKCFVDTIRKVIYFIGRNGGQTADITYSTNVNGGNALILKLDTLGNVLAAKAYGELIKGLYVHDAIRFENHIYILCQSNGGGGDWEVNANIYDNAWIAMVDTNANLVGKYTINGNWNDDLLTGFIYNGNLYAAGTIWGHAPNTEGCTPTDSMGEYIVKVLPYPLQNSDITKLESKLFTIHPNPSSSNFTVDVYEKGAFNYRIFDINGMLIEEHNLNEKTFQIKTTTWRKGNYFLIFTQGKISQTSIISYQ